MLLDDSGWFSILEAEMKESIWNTPNQEMHLELVHWEKLEVRRA